MADRLPVSDEISRLIGQIFREHSQREEAIEQLETDCGRTIPGFETDTVEDEDLYNIRRSVLHESGGSLKRLQELIGVVNDDWRYLPLW